MLVMQAFVDVKHQRLLKGIYFSIKTMTESDSNIHAVVNDLFYLIFYNGLLSFHVTIICFPWIFFTHKT